MSGPSDVIALVLAAGQGTRMKSDLAKVLHPMNGRPLLAWVLDALEDVSPAREVVVIGHQRERVKQEFAKAKVEWAVQDRQCGTGHAVQMAEPALAGFKGTLLVVCGDTPLLRGATLNDLVAHHQNTRAAVTVLSMRLPDPSGYGRIVRDAEDGIAAIVEERDATPAQRTIDEVNSGIYAFDYPALARVLSQLSSHNAQGEYYLTDTVALLRDRGLRTSVICGNDYRELLGVNTPEQLAEAGRIQAARASGGGTPADRA